MLEREKQVIIKDLEGSGSCLTSGNILSLAGANRENHKRKVNLTS